ncbi:MAG: hypothetical protein V1707_03405, partial [bacterium]
MLFIITLVFLLFNAVSAQQQMTETEIQNVLEKYHSLEQIKEWNSRINQWNAYQEKKAGKDNPRRYMWLLSTSPSYLEQELPVNNDDPYYWPIMINGRELKQLRVIITELQKESTKWNQKTDRSFIALVTINGILHLWLLHQQGK